MRFALKTQRPNSQAGPGPRGSPLSLINNALSHILTDYDSGNEFRQLDRGHSLVIMG